MTDNRSCSLALMLLMTLGLTQAQQTSARDGDLQRLRTRAMGGIAEAQNELGWKYAMGDGVTKDAAQAVTWFRKAAEQGDADAQTKLAFMYYGGDGVPKDLVTAYMWCNLAAAQGYEPAKTTRDLLEILMTPAQIAEAQKLSREWKPKK